jgi:hypothetical protein
MEVPEDTGGWGCAKLPGQVTPRDRLTLGAESQEAPDTQLPPPPGSHTLTPDLNSCTVT